MNQTELAERLSTPFAPEEVDWRIGSTTKDKTKGMALAYIDARTVMRRLDEVVGVDGWQCENKELRAGKVIICSIGIRMDNGEWIWKSDGAGDTAVEAEKGVLSDAFKRAAVRWGIGRYLYELPSPWVALEHDGRRIAAAETAKLERIAADALETFERGRPIGHVPSGREVEDIVKRLMTAKTHEEVRALGKRVWPLVASGTALGDAITKGIRRFDPTYDPAQKASQKTDGAPNDAAPERAEEVAKPSLRRVAGQKGRA